MKRFLLMSLLVFAVLGVCVVSETKADTPPLNEEYLDKLPVLTHPQLFKWRFSDWDGRQPQEAVAVKTPVPTPKPTPKPTVAPTPEPTPEPTPSIPERPDEPINWIAMPVRTVYFDYDKSNLKPAAVNALETNINFLEENPDYDVLIEGHCDERGTQEYNMALGERRANAIKSYLVEHGIDADRITTKSWGEELPVALGHNEAAWSRNRRGEMYYSE